MKITKVGILTPQNEIVGLEHCRKPRVLFAVTTFTNLPRDEAWQVNAVEYFLPIILGQNENQRTIKFSVWIPSTLLDLQLSKPVSFFGAESFCEHKGEYDALLVFQNQLFVASTQFVDSTSIEEATLHVEKLVYSRENRLKRLRQEVVAMQRAESAVGPQRTAIPETVRLLVWIRDGGKCVRCGSSLKLHFDHIIPVSKGGGSTEHNIQILCERCNLQKSDRIMF